MKFIKNKVLLLLLAVSFLSTACSSLKEKAASEKIEKFPAFADASFNLKTKLKITIKSEEFSTLIYATAIIAKEDSVSLTLRAPFGPLLGKLRADKKEFVFYNVLTGQVIVGSPTAENLESVLKIPLSLEYFVRAIKGEPLASAKAYKYLKETEKGSLFLAKRENRAFFAVVRDSAIIQNQAKDENGETILNVFYDDFKTVSGEKIPLAQNYYLPQRKTQITIRLSDVALPRNFKSPFRVKLPKGVPVIKI